MGNFKQGVDIRSTTTTATTGGTTSLVYNSTEGQRFTGSLNQTVVLPAANSNMGVGQRFIIMNRSTGTITVQDGSSATIATISAGSQTRFKLISIASVAGSWDISTVASSSGSGLQNSDYLAISGAKSGSYSELSRLIKVHPQEVGGDFWTTRTSLVSGIIQCPAPFTLNGFLYGASGYTGSASTVSQYYDDAKNYTLARGSLTTARFFAGSFVAGGLGYVAGGTAGSNIGITSSEKYSDSTNTWTSATALTTASGSAFSFALSDFGFVVGGTNAGASLITNNQMYSSSLSAWITRQPLSTAQGYNQGASTNTYGYAPGGEQGAATAVSQRYNLATNSWAATASLQSASERGNVAAVDPFVYRSGGTSTTSHEVYAEFSNAWTSRRSLTTGANSAYAGAINGSVYVLGTGSAGTIQQYSNFSWLNLGSIKRSTLIPSAILVSAQIDGVAYTVPAQVRTAGNVWTPMLANSDTATRTGDTMKYRFDRSRMLHRIGGNNGSNVNTVETYSDSNNAWRARGNAPFTYYQGTEFSFDGIGYYAGGNQGATQYATTTYAYNEILDTHTLKSGVLPQGLYGVGGNTASDGFGWVPGGRITGGAFTNSNYRYDPTADTYATKTVRPANAWSAGTGALNGRIYSAGGENIGGYLSANYQYDTFTDSWTSKAGVGFNDGYPSAWSINGYFFLNGGSNGSSYVTTTQKYDDSANSWTNLAGSSRGSYGGCAGIYNGFGYSAGGAILAGGNYSTAERFNDAGNTWTSVASLSTGISTFAITGASNYRNYEIRVGLPAWIGGVGAGSWTTKAALPAANTGYSFQVSGRLFFQNGGSNTISYTYDEPNDSWSSTSTSGLSYNHYCGMAFNGFGYGMGYLSGGLYYPYASRYNDEVKTWSTINSYNTGRYIPSGFSLNGYGYVAGGLNSSNTPLGSIERYNDQTGSWTAMSGSAALGTNSNASVGVGGFGYFLGGTQSNSAAIQAAQYNDAADAFTTKGTLVQPAGSNGAMTYGDQPVCVGGYYATGGGNSNTVQTFNLSGNYWYQLANLPSLVTNALSASTMNGAMYMPGGYNGGSLSTNYRYNANKTQQVVGVSLKVTES